MPIVILLLALIVLVLCFGPLAAAFAGLVGAAAGSILAAIFLAGLALVCGGSTICFLIWCVWWCFDRKAATAGLRASQRAYEPRS